MKNIFFRKLAFYRFQFSSGRKSPKLIQICTFPY